MSTGELDEVCGAPWSSDALLLGAPGSGKTEALIQRLVAITVQGVSADDVLMITPQRQQATVLRDRVALALQKTTSGPRVRSMASFAFAIVASAHRERGLPAPDVLTASQIDADMHAILQGHEEDGTGPAWPEPLGPEVRDTGTFRGELREFLARASEYGLSRDQIDRFANQLSRPSWRAAAEFREEFEAVVSSGRPGAFDSAGIIRRAIVVLEDGLPQDFATLRHVCVDDAQDMTKAGLDLLRALHDLGVRFTVSVNPDTASNTFRGAAPGAVSELAAEWGVDPTVLPATYRQAEPALQLVQEVTNRIGAAGFGLHRNGRPRAGHTTELWTLRSPSAQREARDIARLLTRAHLDEGVPWEDMAVIARRGSQVSHILRELSVSGIPARASVAGTPLREHPAARELLELVAVGRGIMPLGPVTAVSVLSSRYGQLTPHDVRRLRFHLRVTQDPEGAYRSADVLLAEELAHRGGFVTLDSPAARRAHLIAELLDDIRTTPDTAPVTEVLWSVLERTGALAQWSSKALEWGSAHGSVHRALDALVALFAQAEDFVVAHPGGSLELFLESVLDSALPEDVVMPEPAWPAVTVATPARVAGREFSLVVVAGVNESVWPDLRLRDSLLGTQQLARVAEGIDSRALDERRVVLEDELRMYALALSRATHRVIVTATDSEESSPSVFFGLAERFSTPHDSSPEPPPTVRSAVARLRHALTDVIEREGEDAAIAGDLALASTLGAPGAHPDDWWGILDVSSTEPLYGDGEVPISPSGLAALEESPVEWFLDQIAGGESTSERGLGVLIHQALEEHPLGTSSELWEVVEKKFDQLEFDAGWIAEHQRRLAQGMIDALADYLRDRAEEGAKALASEARFRIEHGRAVVTGVIDRIEQNKDGALLVVDLKTGSPRTDSAVMDDPQMLTYQLAAETTELIEQCGLQDASLAGAALLFVKSGVRGKRYRIALQEPMNDETRLRMLERLSDAAEVISRSQFAGEPRSFGGPGKPSRHRWHFVGQVCGDD